jgi:hypothetical protein
LYGIQGVVGADIRPVKLPAQSPRGGLLTQASILKVTANGTTTSPVVRGKWVLERLLGIEADPPPPGLPAIEPDIRGAVTVMEQLEKHRNAAVCASCHAKFDPLGVALECFDVMGQYRDHYRALDPDKTDAKINYVPEELPVQKFKEGLPVVASYALANGEAFQDIREFKEILARNDARLAESFSLCHFSIHFRREIQFQRPLRMHATNLMTFHDAWFAFATTWASTCRTLCRPGLRCGRFVQSSTIHWMRRHSRWSRLCRDD